MHLACGVKGEAEAISGAPAATWDQRVERGRALRYAHATGPCTAVVAEGDTREFARE